MANVTVAEVYGAEIANRLAMWAIDALCEPPAKIETFATRIPAHVIVRGRGILDDAGIDWRKLKRGASSAHSMRRGAS